MKKFRYYLFLVAIIFLAFTLRFYNLGTVPSGLQQDESSIGYNAYSILETGKDEYGKSLPIAFKAFGEYKLPLSIYLTTGSFAIFGVSELSLRLPSALFGLLTVVLVYFLVFEMYGNRNLALISSFLLSINPWHIHFSRGAYEVTPALFLITLGVYLFLVFIRKKSLLILTGSLTALVLSLYGYNIARLFIPTIIVLLGVIFYKKISGINKSGLLVSIIIPCIALIPFVVSLLSKGGFDSTKGTLIPTSAVVQAENLQTRSYILQSSPIASKILFNTPVSDVLFYLKNVVSYVDGDFFFGNGPSHGNHGIGNVGLFHVWEILTLIIGVVTLTRRNDKNKLILFGWTAGVILIASFTREAPQATRSFFAVAPLTIISAVGLYEMFSRVLKLKKYSTIVLISLLLFGIYSFAYYAASYFYKFPVQYAKEYRSEDKRLVLALKKLESNFWE